MIEQKYDTERIENTAQKVLLLLQFAADLIPDIDLIKETNALANRKHSNAANGAVIISALGGDALYAMDKTRALSERAEALYTFIKALQDTENRLMELERTSTNKAKMRAELATVLGM